MRNSKRKPELRQHKFATPTVNSGWSLNRFTYPKKAGQENLLRDLDGRLE